LVAAQHEVLLLVVGEIHEVLLNARPTKRLATRVVDLIVDTIVHVLGADQRRLYLSALEVENGVVLERTEELLRLLLDF